MFLGQAGDGGESIVGADIFLVLSLVALVAVPAAAVALGVRARRRSAAGRVPSTGWATAAFTVTSVVLGLSVAAFVYGLVNASFGGDSPQATIGPIEVRNGSYVVAGESTYLEAVCPLIRGRNEVGGYVRLQQECRASTLLGRSKPAGARVTGVTFDVETANPTTADRLKFNALSWGGVAIWILGLVAVQRILRRAKLREPFAVENVRWLRVLAACVAIGGFVVGVLVNRFADSLIERSLRGSGALEESSFVLIHRPASTDVGLAPLLVAFLILVLAEVWRFGIRLQEDVEATV